MTANRTRNSSETEFVLIRLENQLAKIGLHNSLLDISHSARNLGFIFDEHLTFSDQITSLSKACYYHITFINFAVSGLTSIRQSSALPLLSFTASLITVILSTVNSLSLNYPVSSRSRTFARLSPVILVPSYVFSTGSESLNAWNTSSSHLQSSRNYTQLACLHNLISVQRPRRTRSSSDVALARPPTSSSLKITDRSFRCASPCLWNQLYLFVNIIMVAFPT